MTTAFINLTAHYNEIKSGMNHGFSNAAFERLNTDVLQIANSLGPDAFLLTDDSDDHTIALDNINNQIDTAIFTGTGIDDIMADKVENYVEKNNSVRTIFVKNATLSIDKNLNYSAAKPLPASALSMTIVNKANFAFADTVEHALEMANDPQKFDKEQENAWRYVAFEHRG